MTRPERPPARTACPSPLDAPLNLALDVSELLAGLRASVARRQWLEAAFAAAGMLQALDDTVAGTSTYRGRALSMVSQRGGRLGTATLRLQRASEVARGVLPSTRAARRSLSGCRAVLAELAVHAATGALSRQEARPEVCDALTRRLCALAEDLPRTVLAAVARIPSSFCAFDDHIDDVARLAMPIAAAVRPRTPVVVVGVRTSGSYLAPVLAAQLRRSGVRDVRIASARPHQPLGADDAAAVRRAAAAGGTVVVTDDSPSSGSAVASVCRSLSAHGVGQESLCLALLLSAGMTGLPPRLSGYRAVTLPWAEWSIHERLSAPRVRRSLQRLLAPDDVGQCTLESRAHTARGHQRAVFAVDVGTGGATRPLRVVAEGVGLGYFAAHHLTVLERLRGSTPRVLGVVDGVLFREWLPDDAARVPTPAAVVDHIRRRATALSVREDRSLALAGAQPVWEVAAERLAVFYGRFGPLARAVFLDRLVKQLVRVDRPSIPDCAMAAGHWFERDGAVVKVEAAGSLFDNRNLITFDAAYDAVGFAAGPTAPDLAGQIRSRYADGVAPLTSEKWLLYDLVHIWDRLSAGAVAPDVARGLESRAVRRYLSAVLLGDVTRNAEGPVVALDVDGVLESRSFGFEAPTPSSVLAVRALLRHGYRPVVVTGRCVDDVTELMDLLLVSAGVAEYGAAVVLPDGTVQPTVTDRQRAAIADVRSRLGGMDGVHVDQRYRHAARAWSVDHPGGRTGLPDAQVRAAATSSVHPVRGDAQTDFVAAGTTKGVGIDALVRALGSGPPVLAVGDTDSDVTLLRSAARAAVPAHASALARAAADVTARRPYQEGFAQVVGDFLGHPVGGCPACAPPAVAAPTGALLSLLEVAEGSRWRAPWRTLRTIDRLRHLAREEGGRP